MWDRWDTFCATMIIFGVVLLACSIIASSHGEPTDSPAETQAETLCSADGSVCVTLESGERSTCGGYGLQYNVTFSSSDPTIRFGYNCGEGVCVEHECWCLLGDLNCDGIVNLKDYKILQAAFGSSG